MPSGRFAVILDRWVPLFTDSGFQHVIHRCATIGSSNGTHADRRTSDGQILSFHKVFFALARAWRTPISIQVCIKGDAPFKFRSVTKYRKGVPFSLLLNDEFLQIGHSCVFSGSYILIIHDRLPVLFMVMWAILLKQRRWKGTMIVK